MLHFKRLSLIAGGLVASALASADHFSWIQWTDYSAGVAHGTIASNQGTVNVTLTGGFDYLDYGYPSWDPTNTWADGSVIDNHVDSNGIAHISQEGSYTLTFDKAVNHLAFGIWSLGNGNETVVYDFNKTLTYVTGGPNAEYGGSSINMLSNHSFSGNEGNGSVIIEDSMTSLTWNIIGAENWHGFTLGLRSDQAVPEPASITLLGLGVAALIKRRRN
ncbi:MAG: PEP-CTERM sorting domain-containing protein [Armatimonadetes bacterium]|nr:PEP-CTERM sorting domain-containing protein [Armatimonadota bacterium]